MRYLIDTQIFIWILEDNPFLKPSIRQILSDISNEFFLSSESIREMAIKVRIGKLALPTDFFTTIEAQRRRLKIKLLPISLPHYKKLSTIRPHTNHNDPSDHVIICQAIVERIPLISADRNFPYYEEQGLRLVIN